METSPSRAAKPITETIKTTTTTTKPNLITHSMPAPPIPYPMPHYPMPYPSYVDPTYAAPYSYDPNWPYATYGAGATYDYSPYYTQPFYPQG